MSQIASTPPSAAAASLLRQTLPSPGRGLIAVGPLLVPDTPRPVPDDALPARYRVLFQPPGEDRAVAVTLHVGRSSPPGDGWAVVRLAALGLDVALKLES